MATDMMIVTNTPAKDLVSTNFAYCSLVDLRHLAAPGSRLVYALVGDTWVLSIGEHKDIPNGNIGLNSVHRKYLRVSTGDAIPVRRFVPPENFNLALLTLELDFLSKAKAREEQVDAVVVAQLLKRRLTGQVMTVGQKVTFEYLGNNFLFTVNQAVVEEVENPDIERGILSEDTYIVFEAASGSGIKITNQRESASSNIFRQKEFNLKALGIGGLSAEFADIFRRAFASRVFPPHVTSKLGIKHVKGMLLYGPPGTGKTLMARQIGKMLNGKEPKIVNGPEVLSKFVGETEKNVRDLFADAEHDQRTRGDQSDLHVIIFDEIDAICKSRGSTRDGTGVHDSIVNQLLTKIDGVEALNNVLLIGMTNRKDLLDEALLRPGRLEVQVEISLPDEAGRLQILEIHTNKMKENSFLSPDVNLAEIVYSRSQDGKWEDRGIGHVAVDYMEKSDDLALFVYEQDSNETILMHRISPDDIYRKQEDTIISWRDPLYSTELAVSFREVAGCSYIWDHICNVRRNSNFGTLNDDTFHGVSSELRELPTVVLSTLPLILKIVVESGITDQMRVTELILRDQEFFQKLMDLFRNCEDLEDLDSLHIIYKIVKGIIMLNSPQIFEKIFGDEFIMDIIGCLEYDPEVSHVRHRDFLEQHVVFKEAIPIKDHVVLSKIHQTYRVGYLKDVVLPRVLDDATAASLNSIVHANNGVVVSLLKEDSTFIRELFSRLRSSGTSADSRKNLVHFLLEFCTLSRSLQTVQQHRLFRDLANEGLFDIISDIMQSEEKRLILAGTDILILSLNQDPNLLRSYVVQPEGNQLLGHLVQGMLTDFGDDMHCQFLEILRTLLDAYSVSASQRDAIIEIFYERHLGQLIDVIMLSCSDVSDSLAKPAAADSVKHSNTKPDILLNICELLCFCVLHHPYRIKCYFLLNNLVDKVLLLTRRKEKYLAVSAVRFIRTVISRNDESLNNYIAKRNLLKPIVDAFVANGDRYNLLNSAVLDLFEFIRKENLKPLLKYLVESFWCQLDKFESLPSIHSLKVKYEQSLESSGTKSVVSVDSRKHVEERALEKEEEDYFNEDSDEEDAASAATPSTQRMKAHPSSSDESSASSPTLSSRPGGLVDYDDDEDDEGYKPPPKRQTDASQEDEDALESLCVKGKLASKDLGVAKKQRLDRNSKSKDSMFAALCSTLSQTVLPNKKATSIIKNASHTSIMKTGVDKDNHQTEKVEVVRSQYDENCSDEQNGSAKKATSQSRSDDTLSKTQENGS